MQKINLSLLGIISAFFGLLSILFPIIEYEIMGITTPIVYTTNEFIMELIGVLLIFIFSHKFKNNSSFYRLLYIGGFLLLLLSYVDFYINIILNLEDYIELSFKIGFYFWMICLIIAVLNLVLEILYNSYSEKLYWIYIVDHNDSTEQLSKNSGLVNELDNSNSDNYDSKDFNEQDGNDLVDDDEEFIMEDDEVNLNVEHTHFNEHKHIENGEYMKDRMIRMMSIFILLIIIPVSIILVLKGT